MKILQDLNGAYYLAKEYVELAVEDAERIIAHARHDLAMAEKFLQDEAAKVNGQADTPAAAEQPAQTDQVAPAEQAPVQPEQPAEQPPAQPEASATSVDAAPAPTDQPAPALDANGNPVQVDPAQDPNQVQPQTEAPVMPPLQ